MRMQVAANHLPQWATLLLLECHCWLAQNIQQKTKQNNKSCAFFSYHMIFIERVFGKRKKKEKEKYWNHYRICWSACIPIKHKPITYIHSTILRQGQKCSLTVAVNTITCLWKSCDGYSWLSTWPHEHPQMEGTSVRDLCLIFKWEGLLIQIFS